MRCFKSKFLFVNLTSYFNQIIFNFKKCPRQSWSVATNIRRQTFESSHWKVAEHYVHCFIHFTIQWQIVVSIRYRISVDGSYGIQTQGCRMAGTDESTGLGALAHNVLLLVCCCTSNKTNITERFRENLWQNSELRNLKQSVLYKGASF